MRDIGILLLLNEEEFITGSDDSTIKLWNLNEKKSLHTFTGHVDCVLALCKVTQNRFLSGAA